MVRAIKCGYNLTGLGVNGYGSASSFLEISALGAACMEVILTFFFVWVVITVSAKEEYQAVSGIVIGAALTAVHLFGIPFTGTSVNPARSFGPALAVFVCKGDASALSQSVVFILAPLVGGLLAAFVYALFLKDGKDAAAEAVGETDDAAESADAATPEAAGAAQTTEVSEGGEEAPEVQETSSENEETDAQESIEIQETGSDD